LDAVSGKSYRTLDVVEANVLPCGAGAETKQEAGERGADHVNGPAVAQAK